MNSFNGENGGRLAVSPAEAARMLGLGRTRLYEEISSGALRSFRFGRRRMIAVAALEEWLAAREADHASGGGGDAR